MIKAVFTSFLALLFGFIWIYSSWFLRTNPILYLESTYEETDNYIVQETVNIPTDGIYYLLIQGVNNKFPYTLQSNSQGTTMSFTQPTSFTIQIHVNLELTGAEIGIEKDNSTRLRENRTYYAFGSLPLHDMEYNITVQSDISSYNSGYLDFALVHEYYNLARAGRIIGFLLFLLFAPVAIRVIRTYRNRLILDRRNKRLQQEKQEQEAIKLMEDDIFAQYYNNQSNRTYEEDTDDR